ncbi:MAG: DUF2905 domain-containing protein [Ignavibacteriaceae bacterium]|nr:DUF2905 domain-containing protein [Ignavibacteriaceae bacterium]
MMQEFSGIGKLLITGGVIMTAAGLIILFWNKIPFIGKLPGDILIRKENFTIYFPIVTSIALSLLISLILYLFRK